MTPCPPARLAAIEAIRDILTRAEWAHDPDTAIEHLAGVPDAVRALTTAINEEREVTAPAIPYDAIAAHYSIGADHGLGPDRSAVTVWDTSTDPPTRVDAPLTNCDACAHDYAWGKRRGCRLVDDDGPDFDEVIDWAAANCDNDISAPLPGATGCPGWKAREP